MRAIHPRCACAQDPEHVYLPMECVTHISQLSTVATSVDTSQTCIQTQPLALTSPTNPPMHPEIHFPVLITITAITHSEPQCAHLKRNNDAPTSTRHFDIINLTIIWFHRNAAYTYVEIHIKSFAQSSLKWMRLFK